MFVFHSESESESESDDESEDDDDKSSEVNDSELSNQGVTKKYVFYNNCCESLVTPFPEVITKGGHEYNISF